LGGTVHVPRLPDRYDLGGAAMIESIDPTWHKIAEGFALRLNGKGRPLAHVVPDGRYAGMWRIQHRDGHLSDMINLARAKDAALSVALGILNPRKDYRESGAGAPRMRSGAGAAP
jgi:hypothetical protein